MANFNIAYQITSAVEGGYSNNPSDNGGETWKGIARKMHSSWSGWELVDKHKQEPDFPSNLYKDADLQNRVLSFYKASQWDVLKLDQVNSQSIANELYDTGVNMGLSTAAKFLQRSLNVLNRSYSSSPLFPDLTVDGLIGSKSLSALNSLSSDDTKVLYKLLNALQGERYILLCEASQSQEQFIRGWASRVFEE